MRHGLSVVGGVQRGSLAPGPTKANVRTPSPGQWFLRGSIPRRPDMMSENEILELCRREIADQAIDPAVTPSAVLGRVMQSLRWSLSGSRIGDHPVVLAYLVGHGILHREIVVRNSSQTVAHRLRQGGCGGMCGRAYAIASATGVYVVADAGSRTRIKRAVSRLIREMR